MRVSVLFYSFFPPRILPTPDVNRSFHNGVLAVSNDMLPIPGTKPKHAQPQKIHIQMLLPCEKKI